MESADVLSHACTEHKIMVFSKALKEVKK